MKSSDSFPKWVWDGFKSKVLYGDRSWQIILLAGLEMIIPGEIWGWGGLLASLPTAFVMILYGFYLQSRDFALWEEAWEKEHGRK